MRIAAVAGLVLMAATAVAQESTPPVDLVGPTVPAYDQPAESYYYGELKTPAIVYGACSLADLATTEYALSRGAGEGNPLMRRRGVRIAIEVGAAVGLTAIDRWAQKRMGKRDLWILRGVAIGMAGALVVNNIKVGYEVGRP